MEEGEKLQDKLGRQKCWQITVNSWDGKEGPTMMRGGVKLLGKVGNCKR
jgi:hypothetical protein